MTLGYDAVIFDMDGTLLDSMRYWRQINVDFLAERGLEPPDDVRADIRDISNRVCARMFAEHYDLGMSMDEIMVEYRRRMGVYYQTEIEPKPDARAYVKWLKRRGVRVCVATASPGELAVPALKRHGLFEPMEFVVSSAGLVVGKDDPAFYRDVAARLGLPCGRCVMFEDALYAAKAAREAGLQVFGIADPVQRVSQEEIKRLCDVYVQGFAELMA